MTIFKLKSEKLQLDKNMVNFFLNEVDWERKVAGRGGKWAELGVGRLRPPPRERASWSAATPQLHRLHCVVTGLADPTLPSHWDHHITPHFNASVTPIEYECPWVPRVCPMSYSFDSGKRYRIQGFISWAYHRWVFSERQRIPGAGSMTLAWSFLLLTVVSVSGLPRHTGCVSEGSL